MDKLVAAIIKTWPQDFMPGTSITAALSGGVDSTALLHILYTIKINNPNLNFTLDAIHINHGISPNADSWVKFCDKFCTDLGIPLKICNHKVNKSGGESLENLARQTRYTEFFKLESNVIALAHHKIDQVETTLSQILRGSDLHNIAAMRSLTNKQNKLLWRPLLNFIKADLEEYATRNNLQHIEDESNHSLDYLRNFLRHEIIPDLVKWDENVMTKILNINQLVQDSVALNDEIAAVDFAACNYDNTLDLAQFKTLSSLRQINLITYFIQKNNLPLPSHKQLAEFVRQVITCQPDKHPQLKLNFNYIIALHKNYIKFTQFN